MSGLSLLDFLRETQTPEPRSWNYVSASRLNLWMKCPLAFRRRYLDGIESPSTPNLFVGKVVHGVLEHVYSCLDVGTVATAEDIPAFVEAAWNRTMENEPCFFDDIESETKSRNQVADLVRTYLSEINVAAEKPIAVEKRFEVPLIDPTTGEDLGIPLVGIVDLVLAGAGGPVVVDFKTAASASSNCELMHELQLSAYAYIGREVFGQDESALEIRQLVKTKTPKIVVHRFPPRSEDHFKRFFGIVREYLYCLDRGVYNYRPGFSCQMCDHAGMCVQ